MKRKYKVEWYEYELTQERWKRFFTKIGAVVFAAYLEAFRDVTPRITRINP